MGRRRDVHEFDADVLAVGAPHNPQDLPDRCRFEAQHVVDEDRPVVIGLHEAVGLGHQFGMDLLFGQAQRIEIGGEMAHDAVGPDQHQSADRILRRAQRCGHGEILAALRGACCQALANVLFGTGIVARQGPDDIGITVALESFERYGPRRPPGVDRRVAALFVQALEKKPPLIGDGSGVAGVLGLHFLDIGAVDAMQEGGSGECVVQRLACHRFIQLHSRERCGFRTAAENKSVNGANLVEIVQPDKVSSV